jgi:hypothetical protein
MVFTFLKNGCQNHTHAHILPPNHLTKARMDFAHSKKQKLLLKIREKTRVFSTCYIPAIYAHPH